MNYKNVAKKKKKNTAIIVVASILALVLAGGAVAGLGFHFDWWGAEEAPQKKEVPTSTYNLEIESFDDLLGVEFTPDDFSIHYTTYNKTKQELVQMGVIESVSDEVDNHSEVMTSVLNVSSDEFFSDYGCDFNLPKDGQYKLTTKINGVEYTTDYCAFAGPESEEGANTVFAAIYFFDEEGKQLEYAIGEEPVDAYEIVYINIYDKFMRDIDHAFEGMEGYTLIVMHNAREGAGTAIGTFEFVSYERIGDVPEGDFDLN